MPTGHHSSRRHLAQSIQHQTDSSQVRIPGPSATTGLRQPALPPTGFPEPAASTFTDVALFLLREPECTPRWFNFVLRSAPDSALIPAASVPENGKTGLPGTGQGSLVRMEPCSGSRCIVRSFLLAIAAARDREDVRGAKPPAPEPQKNAGLKPVEKSGLAPGASLPPDGLHPDRSRRQAVPVPDCGKFVVDLFPTV